MSIPLDRLYHFLLQTAKETCDNDIVIYYFWPHGSKKAEDLKTFTDQSFYDPVNQEIRWRYSIGSPKIFCFDQEPLIHEIYKHVFGPIPDSVDSILAHADLGPDATDRRSLIFGIWDHALLLHSEQNSSEISLFERDRYIPVYYWSHGMIARDWFRYAQHQTQSAHKTPSKYFLIYNRAWSGTREYRLKFMDMLIQNNLVSHCKTSFSPVEPELGIHYSQHEYANPAWRPEHRLENHFPANQASSTSSADFDLHDYESTHWEVVLETLYDDKRWHLTEKILRPIACGQPFLLAGTAGSLQYLRSYGFQTFDGIIDESYDSIQDPVTRLQRLQHVMTEIVRNQRIMDERLRKVVEHNRRHFFSQDFWQKLTTELRDNLSTAFQQLVNTNTSRYFIQRRKAWASHTQLKNILLGSHGSLPRNDIMSILSRARSFYNKTLK